MGDVVDPLKESVFIRDLVNFTWTIAWPGGNHTAGHCLHVNNALAKRRRVQMPHGWEFAINALKLADDARNTWQRSLPLDVRKLNCNLLGVPKRFDLPQSDHYTGACVALNDKGHRVNYVLVAHVHGNVWRCRHNLSFLRPVSTRVAIIRWRSSVADTGVIAEAAEFRCEGHSVVGPSV